MTTRVSRVDEQGFIMVALLVGMAVAAVWMATMLPAWRTLAIREKEENLVFYGNQYARAIALYFNKNNCTLPGDVDILVTGHYLRKKWKDPITGKDFVLQRVGGAAPVGTNPGQGGAAPGGRRGDEPLPLELMSAPFAAQRGGGAPAGGPAGPQGPAGGSIPVNINGQQVPGRGSAPGGQPGGSSGGVPLVGVASVNSESTATSIRLYNNLQQYSLWNFTFSASQTTGVRLISCNSQQGGANQPGANRQGTNPVGPGGALPGGPGGPARPGGPGTGQQRPSPSSGPPPPGIGTGRGRGAS